MEVPVHVQRTRILVELYFALRYMIIQSVCGHLETDKRRIISTTFDMFPNLGLDDNDDMNVLV